MVSKFFFSFAILVSLQSQSQNFAYPTIQSSGKSVNEFIPAGWILLDSAIGDLNGDGKKDIAFVIQSKDTVDEIRPDSSTNHGRSRVLAIAFKNASSYKLALQDNTFITREGEGGMDPDAYDSLSIEKGILIVPLQFVRARAKYKFRYQNDNFFLIGAGFFNVFAAGSKFDAYDINFLTKKYKHEWGEISETKSHVEWNELPQKTLFKLSDLKMPNNTSLTADIII
jgi:hypothetical protein